MRRWESEQWQGASVSCRRGRASRGRFHDSDHPLTANSDRWRLFNLLLSTLITFLWPISDVILWDGCIVLSTSVVPSVAIGRSLEHPAVGNRGSPSSIVSCKNIQVRKYGDGRRQGANGKDKANHPESMQVPRARLGYPRLGLVPEATHDSLQLFCFNCLQ